MKKDDKIMAALLAAAMLGAEKETTAEKERTTEKEGIRKRTEELGKVMHQSYLGFIDAGFTEEQAFQLVLTIRRS